MSNNAQLQTLIRGPSNGKQGGSGEAGSVFIEATDSVSLSQSAIFSTIERGADGSSFKNQFAGNIFGNDSDIVGSIYINTGSLSLANGSQINASTLGRGNAGAVLVKADDEVSLENGSVILSGVGDKARGNAGGVFMVADSLSISSPIDGNPSGLTTETNGRGNAGIVLVLADEDVSLTGKSAILSTALATSSGNSGGIGIRARALFIRDGAVVNVNNLGLGTAGAIEIEAREDIILKDQGRITAVALSGNGGNVELESGDFLLTLSRSQISTTSGSLFLPGNGGDVSVDTRFVIAAPFNDNDLDAQAFGGKGGRIEVEADRLYDIEERSLSSLSNDISATSGFGEPGEVGISPLNPDPTQGLTNLPANPVDPSTLIAESCAPRGGIAERQRNRFIVTGRGGLPPDPNAAFPGEAVVNDLVIPDEGEENTTDDPNSTNPTSPAPVATNSPQQPEMVEAQGWVHGENGDIIFTAKAPTVTPNSPVLTPASTCNASSMLPQ
jgi:large exoprotein involved in heme utilization and adhesion